MGLQSDEPEANDHGKLCLVCTRFEIRPAAPAMDPSGKSQDQVDHLCRTHRIRAMRGYCVLCGMGNTWASPFADASIGCCRHCLFQHHGLNKARWIEQEIEGSDTGINKSGDEWLTN